MPRFEERPLPRLAGKGPTGVNDFYKTLGWQEGLSVDQSKVAIHPDDYAGICMELALTKDPEARVMALGMWLFCGPQPDSAIPRSKVRLYPGCFAKKRTA